MRFGASVVLFMLLLAAPLGAAQAPFKSPDSALAYYIRSANARDLVGINTTFLTPVSDFNFYGPQIESFSVTKRIRYTEKDVRRWKQKGITAPVAVGDLELHVREIVEGKPHTYSYNFRETPAGWKIVTYAAWDQ